MGQINIHFKSIWKSSVWFVESLGLPRINYRFQISKFPFCLGCINPWSDKGVTGWQFEIQMLNWKLPCSLFNSKKVCLYWEWSGEMKLKNKHMICENFLRKQILVATTLPYKIFANIKSKASKLCAKIHANLKH